MCKQFHFFCSDIRIRITGSTKKNANPKHCFKWCFLSPGFWYPPTYSRVLISSYLFQGFDILLPIPGWIHSFHTFLDKRQWRQHLKVTTVFLIVLIILSWELIKVSIKSMHENKQEKVKNHALVREKKCNILFFSSFSFWFINFWSLTVFNKGRLCIWRLVDCRCQVGISSWW